MTLAALQAPALLSPWGGAVPTGLISTAVGSDLNFTFNAAGDKIAFVFTSPGTTVPDLVSFHIDTVTTAGSAGTIDCTLETLAADGTPSGTPVTSSATASVTASTTGVKNASGMAGTAAVVRGTQYAVVIAAGSGWNRNLTIKQCTGSSQGFIAIPYSLTKDTAGAWTKLGGMNLGWCLGLANTGGVYINIPGLMGAYSAAALQSYTDATNPDERGNRFNLAVPATCIGAVLVMVTASTPDSTNGYTVSLYSSHTATRVSLATVAMDGDAQLGNAAHLILFDTAVDLTASTTYAIGVKATAAGSIQPVRWDYQANADLAGHLGISFYSTTANNGSDFTDANTSVYGVYPLFSQFDAGGGGGGLLYRSSMSGNL